MKQITESQSCEESVWLYYKHITEVTPPRVSVPESPCKKDLDTVRVLSLGNWFSALSSLCLRAHYLGSYLITPSEEVTHALVFVFTPHITHYRESCSKGLLCSVLVSREKILFSQEWVERHLVGGTLVGAIAPCLGTVIYCSL